MLDLSEAYFVTLHCRSGRQDSGVARSLCFTSFLGTFFREKELNFPNSYVTNNWRYKKQHNLPIE